MEPPQEHASFGSVSNEFQAQQKLRSQRKPRVGRKVLGGLLLLGIIISFIAFISNGNRNVKTVSSPAPDVERSAGALPVASTPSAKVNYQDPQEVTITLDNYRYKGDTQRIRCSGPTGNITCTTIKP